MACAHFRSTETRDRGRWVKAGKNSQRGERQVGETRGRRQETEEKERRLQIEGQIEGLGGQQMAMQRRKAGVWLDAPVDRPGRHYRGGRHGKLWLAPSFWVLCVWRPKYHPGVYTQNRTVEP